MAGGSQEYETERDNVNRGNRMARPRVSTRNRESCDEIAELEAELRRAYVAKELRTQLLERETERYVESVQRRRAEELARLEQQAAGREDELRRRSENVGKVDGYRKALAEQIERKQADRGERLEEERIEREILAEIDRINEQIDRAKRTEARAELTERTGRERFIQREIKRIRAEIETEAEERKHLEDEEYLTVLDRRAREARKLQAERLERADKTACEIAAVLMDEEGRKREREALLIELMVEDVKWQLMAREEEERTRRTRLKEELAADLEEQIVFNEDAKLRFIEQDKAFGEQIMRKVMEHERTVRLTAEARRRMQLRYREDLSRLIEARQRIREEEISNARETGRRDVSREESRHRDIAERRKHLLREHASYVADFLDRNKLLEEERRSIPKLC